ncbi:hypothetical protein UFOVP413_15 [uncultured Caudovirales phage]|uniref:Uncharacterized protein n=1 Tax=uncultured Caudovirales phage TaxID=2100421 RepID=A0A6J5M4B1_9CAUD|nr:hypothetical protein UFOVP413_15 [uncultured Caudovirales phage]
MANKRGGKRENAGRKPGAVTQITRAIAEEKLPEGITPLEVLLETMREAWHKGEKTTACAIAKDAAPYCHAKIAPVDKETGKTAAPIMYYIPIEQRENDPENMAAARGAAD